LSKKNWRFFLIDILESIEKSKDMSANSLSRTSWGMKKQGIRFDGSSQKKKSPSVKPGLVYKNKSRAVRPAYFGSGVLLRNLC
jgi:hypothetical protein